MHKEQRKEIEEGIEEQSFADLGDSGKRKTISAPMSTVSSVKYLAKEAVLKNSISIPGYAGMYLRG